MIRKLALVLALTLTALIAHAQSIQLSFPLGANPNGDRDTGFPCLDGVTACKAPAVVNLSWNSACLSGALAPFTNVQVGTPVASAVEACLSGTNAAAALIKFVQTTNNGVDCFADFTTTGTTPNRNITDAAVSAGTGSCQLKATYMTDSATSGSVTWNNVQPPPAMDRTPGTPVTGLSCVAGTLQATCSWEPQPDPDHNVPRTGISKYNVYSNGVLVDTLNAVSPGLVMDFVGQQIGSAGACTPSSTQGAAAAGAQWNVVGCGQGIDGAADSFWANAVAVSGDGCIVKRIDSLAAAMTYNKAMSGFRNSASGTSASYAGDLMLQGTTQLYMQRVMRTQDGAGNQTVTVGPLAVTFPIFTKTCVQANVGGVWWSPDGTTWTAVVNSDPITLNASKLAFFAPTTTTTGADTANVSAQFGFVAVNTGGTLSKVVTLTAGAKTITLTDVDVAGNESTALAGVSITVASGGGGAGIHKFNPGYYARAHTAKLNCASGCDATRHSLYSQIFPEANIKGTAIWISWKYLESDAGGDFTAGMSWLTNELAYFAAHYPGKQIGLLLDISPYGWSLSNANSAFPQYFVNAGCVYDENSAASGGGSTSLNWYKTNPTCMNFYKRMIAAYGAVFDSNATLEFVRVQQETDDAVNNVGVPGAAEDTAWKTIALATATAFPTTLVWIPMNWIGVETAANKEAMLAYYKSIQVGVGDGDTIPVIAPNPGYNCPSDAMGCVIRGRNASIGASSHDYCGEFVSISSMELSESGYNTVPPGNLSAQQVSNAWNDECAQYGEWEPNFGEIFNDGQGGATQFWNGATGQKWAIDNIPLTHTTKPAGYN